MCARPSNSKGGNISIFFSICFTTARQFFSFSANFEEVNQFLKISIYAKMFRKLMDNTRIKLHNYAEFS